MAKLKIEERPVEALVPYARNARTHSDDQVDQLARSILEFGWTNPILLDGKAGIIAGHGRVLAAKKLGLAKVPCIQLAHLSSSQKRAYIIADNKLAENAGWDEPTLAFELGELSKKGFDLGLTGFGELELQALNGRVSVTEGETDPDAIPEPEERRISACGDLWRLGRHRLLCGDSTSELDVARLLDGAGPHLMVTDPPYGVEYDPDWRNRADRANGAPYGASSVGKVQNDDRADWSEAWALFPGDTAYCWAPPGAQFCEHIAALASAGFEPRATIIWAKQHFPIGRGHYHVQHEPCIYAVRKGKTGHWQGSRKETTLWEIANACSFGGNQEDKTNHGTQKPVECMRRPIENNSAPGQAVYDPFVGSGTTIIAAEQTGRTCYAMELDPGYCDIAVRRWQGFTGEEAILDGTEKTFAQVEAE